MVLLLIKTCLYRSRRFPKGERKAPRSYPQVRNSLKTKAPVSMWNSMKKPRTPAFRRGEAKCHTVPPWFDLRLNAETLLRLNAAGSASAWHRGGSGVSYPALPPSACTERRLSGGQRSVFVPSLLLIFNNKVLYHLFFILSINNTKLFKRIDFFNKKLYNLSRKGWF